MQVCASVAAVEAAMAECLRVARIPLTVDGPVPRTDVESLVAACTAAVSSPVVAERFGEVIESLCDSEHEIENGDACSAAGAIPVLVEAVRAHGSGWINVARNGIGALGALIMGVESNADAFVSSPFGGLDVILTVMAAHVLDYDLQRTACWALYNIIRSASATARARLRGGSAEVVKHLNTAIRMHPKEGAWALRDWAQLALTQLVPSQE